jgi:hypothetical protein
MLGKWGVTVFIFGDDYLMNDCAGVVYCLVGECLRTIEDVTFIS